MSISSLLLGGWQKLGVYAVAGVLLAGLGAGGTWFFTSSIMARQSAAIEALEARVLAAQERAKADSAVLVRRAKKNAQDQALASQRAKKLDAVSSASKEWADQPVPAAVQEALKP